MDDDFRLTPPDDKIWKSVHFSNETEHWSTPADLYRALDLEFRFTLDPCPLHSSFDGLVRNWAHERIYCNPPYGAEIEKWLRKSGEAGIAVYLLPARTDTAWWHNWAERAKEVRFLRGRLKFGGATDSAPFPSVLLIFEKT